MIWNDDISFEGFAKITLHFMKGRLYLCLNF